MADLATRVLLNDKQFNDAITRSKKEIQKFENASKKFGAGIIKGASAAAVAIGAGTGAVELFDKFINASQTTGDAWAGKIEQMKSSVDNFFYSINTGDTTSFLMGLSEIKRQAQETYEALDQLGNVRISYSYLGNTKDAEIAEKRALAMEETLPKEEREKALSDWENLVKQKKDMAINASKAAQDALYKMVVQDTMIEPDDINLEDYDRVLALDLKNEKYREEEKAMLAKQYEEYVSMNEKVSKDKYTLKNRKSLQKEGTIWYKQTIDSLDDIEQKQRKLAETYKDAILYNKLLVRIKDEDLEATTAIAKESDLMMRDVYNNQNQLNRARKRVTNSIEKAPKNSKEGSGGSLNKQEALQGSLDWYSAEIKSLQQQLSNSTDVNVSGKLQQQINQLNDEKINLQFVIDSMAFKQLHGELETKFKENPIPLTKGLETDISSTKIESITPIKSESIDIVNDTTQAMYGLSSIMSSINSITAEGAIGWLQYGANLVSSIASAISQITALTAAKKTDAATDLAATSSKITNMAAETSAQGVALATQTATEAATSSIKTTMATTEMAAKSAAAFAAIPFAGPALAAAQIASFKTLIAASSIPTFATGGIVPGGSFIGDKVPVLANSGEMILNNKQQSNLFNMLDKGSSNNAVVSLSESRVRGSDIYLSLSNYMKKTGKKL